MLNLRKAYMPQTATILTVDDNDALRYSLTRTLRGEGYKVIEARTGAEALALAAQSSVPARLEASAFNQQTGKIAWPKALLDTQFNAKRTEIEKLAAMRAHTTGKPETVKKIKAATVEMTSMLKSNVTKMPANDYMQARKFLDSLAVTVSQG